ncbi:MAG: carbohydrate ABC transporter permease [bacterium]
MRKRIKGLNLSRRRTIEGYLFVLPWIIGFIVFFGGPLLYSFGLTFFERSLFSEAKFIGLGNYIEALFEDEQFTPKLFQTILQNLIITPLLLMGSLILAMMVNQGVRGVKVFRAIYFLPVVVGSDVLIIKLYAVMGGSGKLFSLDLEGFDMFIRPEILRQITNYILIALFNLWRCGIQVLIFLAGLQNISPTIYEAASIDGADEWKKFWSITLPLLSPIILLNVVISIVDSFTSTTNWVLGYIRDTLFRGGFRYGYSSTIAWIYFIVIFIIILAVFFNSRQYIHYEGER